MLPRFLRSALAREEAIPILRVGNARESARWYSRLGFQQEWEQQFAPGLPLFISMQRRGVRLFLSEHTGDARPDTLVYIRVKNVEGVAEEFGAAITKQPWLSKSISPTQTETASESARQHKENRVGR